MAQISRTALVTYSASQMYDLVRDVEAYPEFLPGCVGGAILKEESDIIEATLDLSKGGLSHGFTTRNRMVSNECIEMELLEGPFRYLRGVWHFKPLGEEGCKVSLDLEFEMSNAITQMTLGAVFSQMVGTMVDAFIDRAKQIYG